MIQLLAAVILSVALVTAMTTGTEPAAPEKSSGTISTRQQDRLLPPPSVNSSLYIPSDSLALPGTPAPL